MGHTHDVIIIGRGLAGAVLSEVLAARGLRVMIFDAAGEGRASHVATGLVNPIVMRRTLPSWRASEMLAIAGAFYRDLEQRYDQRIWYPLSLVEIFPTAKEAGVWRSRLKDPEIARLITDEPSADPAIADLPQRYGHGQVNRCARLDLRALLAAHGTRWAAAGMLEQRHVGAEDIQDRGDAVEVFGRTAPWLIRCAGAFGTTQGLVPVRGEGLTVHLPGLRLRSAVHRGVFIVPVGEERYRVGSTFAWDDVWSGPTEEARRWLLDGLGRVIERPAVVEEHWAGVRPAARDRRPILGRTGRNTAVMNGLGSRGVLLAPWSAQHLVAHLFDGEPLDPEVDVHRFA